MYKFLIIILLSLLVKNVCSQNWEQTLSVEDHTEIRDIIEDYDRGTLLLSTIYNTGSESSTFLSKHDIDGKIIRFIKIGVLEDIIYSISLKVLPDGSIIIGGGENKTSNTTSSFVLKLNSCRELEWLKILGDESNNDFVTDILILNDGNVLVQASYVGDERISLFKISPDGETMWRKNFFSLVLGGAQDYDPEIGYYQASRVDAMINTEDEGIALSGVIYMPYLLDSTLVELKSYIMKLDSEGNREWVYVHGDSIPGHRTNSEDLIEVSDGYVVLGAKRFSANPQSSIRSHLYKVDNNGALLWEKEQTDTLMKSVGFGIEAFDDGSFALMTHAYTGEEIPGTNYESWVKAYKTDTLGNIMDSVVYGKGLNKNTKALSMSKTMDNKMLIGGFQDSANFRSAYYLRIQEDLSIDTFTNEILNYDTLCNKTITDSFIAFDTAVSIIDFGALEYELKVYPNPVSKFIYFEIENLENVAYTLNIYDIEGKLIKRRKDVKDSLLKLNLEDFKIGNYFYALEYQNRNIVEGKFVVE